MTPLGEMFLLSRATHCIALARQHQMELSHVGEPTRTRHKKAARKRLQEAHRDLAALVAELGKELAKP
jgi:hypothetical protein